MQKDNLFTAKGFMIWGICALFFMYEFFLRTVIGTFQHPITYDLNLTSFKFSILSTTTFLVVYGLMQIPAGIIIDHIGLKKSLLIGAFTCSIASIGFAFSHSFSMAVFFRLMTGFGAAFGFLCLLVSMYSWLPNKYSAIFTGLSQFIGTMGPMLAAGPLESLAEGQNVDWRYVMMVLSVIGFSLTAIIFFFVQNKKNHAGKFTILHHPESILSSLKRLLKKQAWYIGIFSTLVYFTIEYLSENEGKLFIQLKGFDASFAAYMMTIAWFGYAVGCPALGFFSDYFDRRRPAMIFAAFSVSLAFFGIIYGTTSSILILSFLFLGIGAGAQSVCFATIAEQFKKNHVALGLGLNNALIMSILGINAPIIGYFLDLVKTSPSPDLNDYMQIFTILGGVISLSILIPVFFIKETFGKSNTDYTYITLPKSN